MSFQSSSHLLPVGDPFYYSIGGRNPHSLLVKIQIVAAYQTILCWLQGCNLDEFSMCSLLTCPHLVVGQSTPYVCGPHPYLNVCLKIGYRFSVMFDQFLVQILKQPIFRGIPHCGSKPPPRSSQPSQSLPRAMDRSLVGSILVHGGTSIHRSSIWNCPSRGVSPILHMFTDVKRWDSKSTESLIRKKWPLRGPLAPLNWAPPGP